jgi:DNA-directed RNA polymerase specialized sigma24 family protein
MVIELKHLTDKQRRAYFMRFHYGWRMERIALAMGITQPCVSRLLQRALRRAGLPFRRNLRVIRTKPRLASVQSLSRLSADEF